MPTSDELNKLLEMIKAQAGQSVADSAASMLATAQPQAQEQPAPQEQPVQEQDYVRQMTREAMNQMYQKRPILNGPERQAAAGLINYKNAWGQADNPDVQKAMGLNADQIRNLSSKGADNLRQIANGAGMNLTGYGADVSLTDALRNLQSNDARARIEALQGQYAMTSDQFFDRKYDELLLSGSSAREAKAVAGKLAQRYQAERVSYLQGMYHGYGRDGNYTNDFGVDVIGAIANENPILANLYAMVFPNPKDAQTRANTLEDKFIEQNNALSLLNAGLQNDVVRYNVQGAVQDRNADADWRRKFLTLDKESQNKILEYAAKSGIDLNKFIEEETLKQQWAKDKPSEVEAMRKQYFELFKAAGMSDEEATAATQEMLKQYAASLFTGNGRGGTGTGGKSGTGNDKTVDNLKKQHDALVANRDSWYGRLYDKDGFEKKDVPPEEKKKILEQIEKLDQEIAKVTASMGNANGTNDWVFALYPDDSDEILDAKLQRYFESHARNNYVKLRDDMEAYANNVGLPDNFRHRVMQRIRDKFQPKRPDRYR